MVVAKEIQQLAQSALMAAGPLNRPDTRIRPEVDAGGATVADLELTGSGMCFYHHGVGL